MLPKTSTYVKRYDGETKGIFFLLKIMNYQIMVYGVNPVIALRKNFIVSPSTIKKLLKTKITSYDGEATDFVNKEIPKGGSNYICLVVTLIDFVF